MQIFKLFYKIAKKERGTILLYTGISLLLFMINANYSYTASDQFKESKSTIAIIDRDQTELSKGIQRHFKKTQNVTSLKDQKEAFQDALYYEAVDYILIIPKGYEKEITAGKNSKLNFMLSPGNNFGQLAKENGNEYITILTGYIKCGYSIKDSLTAADKVLSKSLKVNYAKNSNITEQRPKFMSLYQFLAYSIPAIMLEMLGTIFIRMNKEDVKKRNICSAYPLRKHNFWLGIASALFAVFIWALFTIVAFLFNSNELKDFVYLKYLLLNSGALTVVSVSIGCVIGFLFHSMNGLSIASNSITLSLAFLTGVFIPITYLSKPIVTIAKFLPTYWYVKANNLICTKVSLSSTDITNLYHYFGIQLCFAAAIFSIALVISKKRQISM
ncbi:hypothetical protein lbkm_1590 [Lachnospiraceae bacterium KM106-2]|nr:hypothetical protein lbkm_1590 [Lachnospiraceae bacterium KM106-2]